MLVEEAESMEGEMALIDHDDMDLYRGEIQELDSQVQGISERIDESIVLFPWTRKRLESRKSKLLVQRQEDLGRLEAATDDYEKNLDAQLAHDAQAQKLVKAEARAGALR